MSGLRLIHTMIRTAAKKITGEPASGHRAVPAGHSRRTVGLIKQQHWCREPASHGKKHARRQRACADKECARWRWAFEQVARRFGADDGPAHFRVRPRIGRVRIPAIPARAPAALRAACQHRLRHQGPRRTPFCGAGGQAQAVVHKTVHIAQRGGRKARVAQLVLRAATREPGLPARTGRAGQALAVNVVVAQEVSAPGGVRRMCWRLPTSEPIDDLKDVRRVVRDDKLRWGIKAYHKAWKSGAGVERQHLPQAGAEVGDQHLRRRALAAIARGCGSRTGNR